MIVDDSLSLSLSRVCNNLASDNSFTTTKPTISVTLLRKLLLRYIDATAATRDLSNIHANTHAYAVGHAIR